jgi:hypothetical protein
MQAEYVRARAHRLGRGNGRRAEQPHAVTVSVQILHAEQEADGDAPIDLGVRITTAGGEPLVPGASGMAAELEFWSDLAEVYVVPGAQFTLRYPIRVVGRGKVLELLPF